jgi:hypothetical protein
VIIKFEIIIELRLLYQNFSMIMALKLEKMGTRCKCILIPKKEKGFAVKEGEQ